MNILRKLSSKHDVSVFIEDQGRLTTRTDEPIFYKGESIKGKVVIKSSSLTHGKIEIKLISNFSCQTVDTYPFTFDSATLKEPGVVSCSWSSSFELDTSAVRCESYEGKLGSIRYVVELSVGQKIRDIVRSVGVALHELVEPPEEVEVTREIVLSEVLEMEIRLNSVHLDINKLIFGTLLFKYCSGTVACVNLELWREETIETGEAYGDNSQMLYSVTIINGFPVLNVEIPYRLMLGGLGLSASCDISSVFMTVRYYLSVVLYDGANRRYFKNINLTLYRTTEQRGIPPKLFSVRQRAAKTFFGFLETQ